MFSFILFTTLLTVHLPNILSQEIQETSVHRIQTLKDLYSFGDPESPEYLVIEPYFSRSPDFKSSQKLLFLNAPVKNSDIFDLSHYVGDIESIQLSYRTNASASNVKISYVMNDGESMKGDSSKLGLSNWQKDKIEDRRLTAVDVSILNSDEQDRSAYLILDEVEIRSLKYDNCSTTGAGYFTSFTEGEYFYCVFSTPHNVWLMYRFKCPKIQESQQVFNQEVGKCVFKSPVPTKGTDPPTMLPTISTSSPPPPPIGG